MNDNDAASAYMFAVNSPYPRDKHVMLLHLLT